MPTITPRPARLELLPVELAAPAAPIEQPGAVDAGVPLTPSFAAVEAERVLGIDFVPSPDSSVGVAPASVNASANI